MPSQQQVTDVLRTVQDPELHRDLVSLNMIKNVAIAEGSIHVHVELTTPACPLKDQITREVQAALRQLEDVREVTVEFSAQVRSQQGPKPGGSMPGVKHIVAVGAGKGGVGKSTASVMLAVGLARSGAAVGLLDSDVYGPSLPTMMGVQGTKPQVANERILPVEAAGVKTISMGFMLEPEQAVIWRGPMIHGVVTQFLQQVEWGELDYLIVDLPPGTGDVPLSLAQSIPMTGAVVVCTPQDVALADARRAVKMYEQLNVACLGIIENMSYYLCPKCGHRDEVFDHGGAEVAAQELNVPFLGGIPLNGKIRAFGDQGKPGHYFTDTGEAVVESIGQVVGNLAGQISVKAMSQAQQPTLSIE
ncbi:MAG: Mrp/NBP35 family ATP-binding protein [Phycisphaerae bacterium]